MGMLVDQPGFWAMPPVFWICNGLLNFCLLAITLWHRSEWQLEHKKALYFFLFYTFVFAIRMFSYAFFMYHNTTEDDFSVQQVTIKLLGCGWNDCCLSIGKQLWLCGWNDPDGFHFHCSTTCSTTQLLRSAVTVFDNVLYVADDRLRLHCDVLHRNTSFCTSSGKRCNAPVSSGVHLRGLHATR